MIVTGPDKELVGNEAAKIRAIRPPEPYKGKGIKYEGEPVSYTHLTLPTILLV